MTSSDHNQAALEPPHKKLKTSPSPSSTTTTTTPTPITNSHSVHTPIDPAASQPQTNIASAKMEDMSTRVIFAGDGAQIQKELQVGIKCFVNENNPGFQGTLKTRYTDFQVFEITPDGVICHLTDDRAPVRKTAAINARKRDASDSQRPETSVAESTCNSLSKDEHEKGNVTASGTQIKIKTEATDQADLSTTSRPVTPSSSKTDDRPTSPQSPTKESNAQLAKTIEAAFSPKRAQSPVSDGSASDDSVIASDDKSLLVGWFGPTLTNDIITLYKEVLSKPNARASSSGDVIETQPIDRASRSPIHSAIKRIFELKLETSTNTAVGSIWIFASSGGNSWKALPANLAARQQANARAQRARNSTEAQGLAPPAQTPSNSQTQVVRQTRNPRQQQHGQPTGKLGWQDLGGEYLHFSLYKENKDTMEVVSYLSMRLGMKPRDFAFAGTKDRRAITVQRVSVRRQPAERLAQLNENLWAARVGNFKYEKHPLALGELSGNHFVITLRDCHFGDDEHLTTESRLERGNKIVGQAVKHLQEHGFINYFGLQRFGTFGIGTDVVGLKILSGDFKGAVDAILTYNKDIIGPPKPSGCEHSYGDRSGRGDDLSRAIAIETFRNRGPKKYIDDMPRMFSAETAIIRHLMKRNCQYDYEGAIMCVSRNLRSMYVHAYQSLVWNTVASERWSRYGNKVVEGDLVFVVHEAAPADEVDESGEVVVHAAADDAAVSRDDVYQRARPLTAAEAASGKYTIFDIVLPLPGFDINYPSNDIGDFYKTFMSSQRGGGIDPGNMRRRNKEFSLSGSYRKVMAEIKDCSFETMIYYDALEELVETDVQKLAKSRGENHMEPFFRKPALRPVAQPAAASDAKSSGPNTNHYRKNNVRREISQEAREMKEKYKNSAALQAWKSLPDNMPAADKASADAAALERKLSNPEDFVAVIKETWIETSTESWKKKTGIKHTIIHNEKKPGETEGRSEVAGSDNSMASASAVSLPASPEVKSEKAAHPHAPEPVPSSQAMDIDEVENKSTTEPHAPTSSAMDVDSKDPHAITSTPHQKWLAGPIEHEAYPTHIDENGVKQSLHPRNPRIAATFKFSLGSSQYATMALRELMKTGGVKTYVPEFHVDR